jgi:phosphatidylglycerol:prolipoprotein diacylglycerol transferase
MLPAHFTFYLCYSIETVQFPIDITIGNFSISSHLVFETLGFIVGFRYYLYLRKQQIDHIPESNRAIILIGAALGGLLFSRLIGALENPGAFFHTPNPWLYFYANKTIVGGLLGGLLGVEIIKKFIHEKRSSGDLFTFPIILALILGRIGCFTMGVHEDTYGTTTNSIFGMNLGDGMKRHPVTLYEIFFLICLWIALLLMEKGVKFKSGYRFQFFMIAYLIFRLSVDFIKPSDKYFYGLGTIQICCIFGLVYYSRTIYRILFKPSLLIAHE